MKISALLLAAALVPSSAAFASKIDADKFVPGKAPKLEGPLEPNEELTTATKLGAGLLQGPEDVAINEKGEIFTGTADGYVQKINLDGTVEPFTFLGGHPLGMDFDAEEGNLYVCEPSLGLFKVDPAGTATLVSDQANGLDFGLTDDVKVASNGRVYFTVDEFQICTRRLRARRS